MQKGSNTTISTDKKIVKIVHAIKDGSVNDTT